MELTDEKIELNGMIHKGVGKILILMAILSVVYGAVFSIIEKTYHMQVIAAFLPVVAIVVWILFIFLRIDRLKLEKGELSLNKENLNKKMFRGIWINMWEHQEYILQ